MTRSEPPDLAHEARCDHGVPMRLACRSCADPLTVGQGDRASFRDGLERRLRGAVVRLVTRLLIRIAAALDTREEHPHA